MFSIFKTDTPGLCNVRSRLTMCVCSFLFAPADPRELPHPPQNLLASLNSSHSHAVVLSWVRPFDGNSPVLHYIVELSENSEYRGEAGAMDKISSLSALTLLTSASGSDPKQPVKRCDALRSFR